MNSRPEIMHLDLDAFFASVEQKLQPELKGKPVIVCNVDSDLIGVDPQGRSCYGSIVSTASYEARVFGVKSGMPTFQAKKLCPEGIFVKGSFGEYEKHSQLVFDIVKRFTPKVEQVSLDEAFLDFKGTNLIYPDLLLIAKKIKETIKKEVGLVASVGIASTKIVAKVASDFNKPDGLTFVPLGKEKEFLSPLPLRDLPGVGKRREKVFKNWGLEKIGDLAALRAELVESNWGKGGLSLWKASYGFDSVWFEERLEQKGISRAITFPYKSNEERYLLSILRFLAEKVAYDMRRKGFKGTCLTLQLRLANFESKSKQIQLSFSTNQSLEIYKGVEEFFFKVWDRKSFVRLLGVGMTNFVSYPEQRQLVLFKDEERLARLDQGVDKIRKKFGFTSILPASSVKESWIERKFFR